ncbi:hypothetical protein GP486_002140 [Trichoglossum hirsutum]|uniref:AAA+ ATPase domain-containing protein n=1 Tax=Trichoglossum hirsutum TaxID=265104 RepID=A0A9P8LFH6_9PEZI|nr:hypothetical protein GP486_002140 [Trichoglossum hirsutum]
MRMHAVRRQALWLLPRLAVPARCRVVAGRRFAPRSRAFHRSAVACTVVPDGRSDKTDPVLAHEPDEGTPVPLQEPIAGVDVAENDEALDTIPPERVQRPKERQGNYGSAARRSVRNRKPREIPPVELPPWFSQNSVRLKEELRTPTDPVLLYKEPTNKQLDSEIELSPARYNLQEDIWKEVLSTIRAGLVLPNPSFADDFPAAKAHVVLQCPKDGGIFFLDSVVEKAASALNADLIRLDAQDLAEIGGDYIGEGQDSGPHSIRSLSYNAQQVVARHKAREMEETEEDEGLEEEEEEEEDHPSSRTSSSHFQMPTISKISAIPIGSFSNLEDLFKSGKLFTGNIVSNGPRLNGTLPLYSRAGAPSSEQWSDMKLSLLLETLTDAGLEKRKALKQGDEPNATDSQETPARAPDDEIPPDALRAPWSTIVMLRDYKEINATPQGERILGRLLDIIQRRRKEGQSIVLVGTVSSADLMPSLSRSAIKSLQSEGEERFSRTIVVTPPRTLAQDGVLAEDGRRRIREINMRHLRDMIRRRSRDDTQSLSSVAQDDWRLDSSLEFASGLSDSVWTFDRVHRVAVSALGCKTREGALTPEDIGRALELLDASDEVKFQWANEERVKSIGGDGLRAPSVAAPPSIESEKMKRLRKICNDHEKKLLGGVVNPENIHTTFKDVRTSHDTVEALRTLTSLSLVRPEAFSYGVLATDKIPGLLLYGPPGTGKTLLAKAVAKESGATVLEVSGAEVYDMYVGEGEKNVKAIFTLAKKLSPCVVFIDEADAIFGSRSSHANRTSHRELINMFLQQWDGMSDLSAFIMVATNRPFDLDDAVLRRLPRRLLVDLPTEKDRTEILKIHLRDETLDPDVSLADIASQTNLYSGSDLKNISVAAALSCVREEIALASTQQPGLNGTSPTPEKRILAKRHFDKALDEISASISEDMSSLAAIRKFDEKYGDRKRKRKSTAWGFGGTADALQQPLETGRVRN